MTESDEPSLGGAQPAPAGPAPASREARLAERLRDNLRRRKAQARARTDADVALSKPPTSG